MRNHSVGMRTGKTALRAEFIMRKIRIEGSLKKKKKIIVIGMHGTFLTSEISLVLTAITPSSYRNWIWGFKIVGNTKKKNHLIPCSFKNDVTYTTLPRRTKMWRRCHLSDFHLLETNVHPPAPWTFSTREKKAEFWGNIRKRWIPC